MRYDEYRVGQRVRNVVLLPDPNGGIPVGTEGVVEAVWPNPPWPQHPNGGAKRHLGWPMVVQFRGQPDDKMAPITGLKGYPVSPTEVEPI